MDLAGRFKTPSPIHRRNTISNPFRDIFSTYELLAYLSYCAPKLGYRCLELPTTRRYPATGQVPTKISSIKGNLSVLTILINACLGQYNPEGQ